MLFDKTSFKTLKREIVLKSLRKSVKIGRKRKFNKSLRDLNCSFILENFLREEEAIEKESHIWRKKKSWKQDIITKDYFPAEIDDEWSKSFSVYFWHGKVFWGIFPASHPWTIGSLMIKIIKLL